MTTIVRTLLTATGRICLLMTALFLTVSATAQDGQINGFVKTSDGTAAEQVNVQLKELKRTTTSREDGAYSLVNIPEGNYTLIISFVGLKTIQKTRGGKGR